MAPYAHDRCRMAAVQPQLIDYESRDSARRRWRENLVERVRHWLESRRPSIVVVCVVVTSNLGLLLLAASGASDGDRAGAFIASLLGPATNALTALSFTRQVRRLHGRHSRNVYLACAIFLPVLAVCADIVVIDGMGWSGC